MRRLAFVVSVAASLLPAGAAQAQRAAAAPTSTMDRQVSVYGAVGYGYGWATGYGLGVRYQWVAAPQGVLKLTNGMKDEIGIEGGIDFLHYSWDYGFGVGSLTYNEFTPIVGAAWNFWVNNQLCVYPKLDLGFHFGTWSDSRFKASTTAVYFQGAAGIAYLLGNRVLLRAEAGWNTLRLGAGFQF